MSLGFAGPLRVQVRRSIASDIGPHYASHPLYVHEKEGTPHASQAGAQAALARACTEAQEALGLPLISDTGRQRLRPTP